MGKSWECSTLSRYRGLKLSFVDSRVPQSFAKRSGRAGVLCWPPACPKTPHRTCHCSKCHFLPVTLASRSPPVSSVSHQSPSSCSSRPVWQSQALTHPTASSSAWNDHQQTWHHQHSSPQRDPSALQTSDLQNSSPKTTHRGRYIISWGFLLLFFLFLPFLCHDTRFVLNILNILIFKKY